VDWVGEELVTGSGLDGRASGDDAAARPTAKMRFPPTGIQILGRNLQGNKIECSPQEMANGSYELGSYRRH